MKIYFHTAVCALHKSLNAGKGMVIIMKISIFYNHIEEAAVQSGKTLAEVLVIARENGIQAVEIDAANLKTAEVEISAELQKAGMTISCICAHSDLGHSNDFRQGFDLIDLAVRTGVEKVLLVPGFIKDTDNRDLVINQQIEAVRAACSYAKSKGVKVYMEDYDDQRAPYSTLKDLYFFLKEIPELGCAFDTGNFLYNEEDAEEALTLLLPYIGHVHMKDRSLSVKEGETPKLTIKGRKLYSSAVGEGCIPMQSICQRLIDNGYQGTLAIEHFGSQNQLEDMQKSAKWLKQISADI